MRHLPLGANGAQLYLFILQSQREAASPTYASQRMSQHVLTGNDKEFQYSKRWL
jgi:hypothetical protein